MPLQPTQIINNRYRIVKLLGKGGYGAVYRAWDLNLNGPCALKENTSKSPAAIQQFSREASILANLQHPSLPRVRDHFVLPGQGQFLVMDFVQGEDLLTRLLKTGNPIPEPDALGWSGQVCDALVYLHGQNPPVIHRDIKPANIVITPDNRAMLVDFGISKLFAQGQQTALGARGVTPGYSPPEQYGQGSTDPRTDIYALGATLYTLLTGQEPPESLNRAPQEILIPAKTLNPGLTSGTSQAIQRAMAINPDQRFQTVAQFQAALRQATPPARPFQQPPAASAPPPQVLPPTSIVQPPPAYPVQQNPSMTGGKGSFSKIFWVVGIILSLAGLAALAVWGINSQKPPGPQIVEFEVQADEIWQDTGVIVQTGDEVTLEYVSGQWRTAPDWSWTGLHGYPNHPSGTFTLPYGELMILIGKIDAGPPFVISGSMAFTAGQDGELWLAPNDDNYADNAGSITVQITAPPR